MSLTEQDILNKYCKPSITNIKFEIDELDEIKMFWVSQNDTEMLKRLNKNVTNEFNSWLINKNKRKENIAINVKGPTRSGKSLTGSKLIYNIVKLYDNKPFNMEYITCANQKEYRLKLKDAEFGDSFLIDENAFNNVGAGSMSEMQQLKDIQNIIAKQNINTIYITPRVFLNTGANYGLSYYGKDLENWVSRWLLFDLTGSFPELLGYIVIDINPLYHENGCYVYRDIGGCTNPLKKTIDNTNKDFIKHSKCIPNDYDKSLLVTTGKTCPFYNICKHPMCDYEHKKDKWIDREMKGGLDERTQERFETALELFKRLAKYDIESGDFILLAKNFKAIKIKVQLYIPMITSTKFTGVELEEMSQILINMKDDNNFFTDICNKLDIDMTEFIKTIPIFNPQEDIKPKTKKQKTLIDEDDY